jgi:hypothetical protein
MHICSYYYINITYIYIVIIIIISMKKNIMLTLDEEIIDRLRLESNKSGFVNNVLSKYYLDNESPEQIELKIKALEIMEEAKLKVKELYNERI